MRSLETTLMAAGCALAGLLGAAQAPPVPAPPAAAPSAGAPGPEHEILKRDEGVWNATVQLVAEPGASPEVSNGVETNVMGPGGLWLITDFKGRLNDRPFQGHGILGYDPIRKKYVRVWVDSALAYLWPAAGDYDPATRTLTLWMEAPGPSGAPELFRTTTVWKDKDTKVYTMYAPGPEATEAASMIITYKRRK